MIVLLKMHAPGKIFDRICLRAARDTFFSRIYGVWSGDRWTQSFAGGNIQQKEKVQTFWFAWRPPKSPSLVGHPDLPIRKNLRKMLDLLTVMILKRVSESIFFQIHPGYTLEDIRGEGIILGENPAGHCIVLVKFVSKNYQRYLFFQVWGLRSRERHDACCLKQISLDACSWNRLAMP